MIQKMVCARITQGHTLLLLVMGLLLLTACSSTASASKNEVRVGGGVDVYPINRAAADGFQSFTGYTVKFEPPSTSLEPLRKGEVDAVLIGRELSNEELQGLTQTVVAYDAVCFIVNRRTYMGGMQINVKPGGQGEVIVPAAKFDGLKNLSRQDVENYLSNLLIKYEGQDRWFLEGSFFSFEPYIQNAQYQFNPGIPNVAVGSWLWNPIDLRGENLQPSRFDTQVAVMQRLGFPLSDLDNRSLSFAFSVFETEEELISSKFPADLPEHLQQMESPYSFDFFVRIVSRRVILRALEYGFFLEALQIDGIDPLGDANNIYGGNYLFSRKIAVVTRDPPTAETQAWINYLVNADGQQAIRSADYLPLPMND
ncbi:MAG: substrate-binding domain-containing protein [Chloroflexota bacterium]